MNSSTVEDSFSFQAGWTRAAAPIQGLAQAIGFLCAGVIFVARGSVYGLTTAASLWMTSSIGMAAGAGMYQIDTVGVIFAFLTVTIMALVMRLFPSTETTSHKDDP